MATSKEPPQWLLWCVLIFMGAGWGLTQPLTKVAVSEEYRQFGLVFWQLVITALFLGMICLVTRRKLPFGRAYLSTYLILALIGTILPNGASYQAMVHLPAGVMSILLSLVPMLAFPIALVLGNEGFRWRRLGGLLLGLLGVLMIVAPETSLPDRAMIAFVPLALIAPFFYAFEGNYVARWGTAGLDPIQTLCGAAVIGAIVTLPAAILAGQWINPLANTWGAPDYALVASSVVHAVVYTLYVWLVGRAGPVFAVQVSYLVTGFGVIWAMLFLQERYSLWIWAAFAVLLVGLTLVQPRKRAPLAPDAT